MVSFSCEACGDVLTKKKLDPHRGRCAGATFTCIDCMVHFPGVQYRSHTSCITEDQKYQGALFREKKKKQKGPNITTPPQSMPKTSQNMALQPYVESIDEGGDGSFVTGRLPEAPSPPPAATEDDVNVFDFLVASGQTPNASNMNLPRNTKGVGLGQYANTSHPNNGEEEADRPDPLAYMDADMEPIQQYATHFLPPGAFVTPAPKSTRRKARDGEGKKDKKRKRLHVDVPSDQVMTDAPPVLHSNLTGGLKGLMRPTLPPSPDYSGGDAADHSPPSPLKKKKHPKHTKHSHAGGGILDIITGGSKTKLRQKRSLKKESSHPARKEKKSKLIGSREKSSTKRYDDAENQLILFKPRADAFLSFVDKGPESERGCSMNKALKRFHRERQAHGSSLTKGKEEKELWRDLRLRRNDRDEIVLFAL